MYQTTHRSSLRSEVVLDVVRDATPVEEMPSNADLSSEQKTQLLEERKLVRELVGLARQQRSQNARTKYARPTGVAPCTPVKLSVEGEGGAEGLTGNRYISFKDKRRRGEEPQIGGAHSRDEYVFITRDIVFCKAGEDYDGSAARDSWYPALIREPLHHSKQRAKCHVKLVWLDPSPRSSPRSFQMNATPVAVRFESLLRDQVNRPLCIMAETAAGVVSYDDGIVVYELDEAICSMADELAGVWEAAGGVMEIEEHSDESDKDDDSDDRGSLVNCSKATGDTGGGADSDGEDHEWP